MVRKTGMLGALCLVAVAHPREARSAAGGCHAVAGTFVAQAPPDCASPVGICTHGRLSGGLQATYDFVATGITPEGALAGHSTITLDNGAVIHGSDTSVLGGDGSFVTTVRIVGGTRQYAHATGALVAPGHFTADGGTAGSYSGTICLGIGANR
jgi:hypothetical protein